MFSLFQSLLDEAHIGADSRYHHLFQGVDPAVGLLDFLAHSAQPGLGVGDLNQSLSKASKSLLGFESFAASSYRAGGQSV